PCAFVAADRSWSRGAPPPWLGHCFSFVLRPPPRPTLFPYTTLFRSAGRRASAWTLPREMERARCHPIPSRNVLRPPVDPGSKREDRKSTRLNSSHVSISYAVFCLKKKK